MQNVACTSLSNTGLWKGDFLFVLRLYKHVYNLKPTLSTWGTAGGIWLCRSEPNMREFTWFYMQKLTYGYLISMYLTITQLGFIGIVKISLNVSHYSVN